MWRKTAFVVLLGMVVTWWWRANAGETSGSVRFFDVGQGDAALISLPAHRQVLIDGGPDSTVLARLGRSMPVGDRTIDAVILSHPHADHYAGLQSVVERYQVGVLYYSTVEPPDQEYQRLLATARDRNIPLVPIDHPSSFSFAGVRIDLIYPTTQFPRYVSNLNDASIVAKVTIRGTTFLFPGDAEVAQEERLIGQGNLRADILKVPHHGSRTSSILEFVTAVDPRLAIISVGARNRYGHPAPQTLQTYVAAGVTTLRTDQQGTVTVTVGPGGYRVATDR